ncbi:tripartite tricarboxylate transporter substrate binding protein [Hydrogenophaga aromaticivorans]|uniref:Tripartite tricarboxylate transporter substrate binding protein n=1 Tax=Hydrogenophaga aromaticivorans TaxID=2610898 RepID=A0A7Y8KXD1_9BURK|nr:tripartite tricarboxylate transporter substrate binding protein [Hydrogenophaga aromaticivorans]MBQ0920355.1 tripartite tricarboxylate transporter substrate binding protein [Hydrogenophaga aromaticivorans]NWF45166.1 tripartite tricarboxylate transporter substrate binding protein [Hydrogenophaga aromaticivorans]
MTFPSPDRRHFCLQLGAGLVGLSAGASWASSFPERSIKIIVPFAPGAGTDAMGRLVAGKLAELLKVSVVVDNRTGASGALGAQEVARAAPDGHTLLLAAAPFTTVPAALPTAGYDPIGSFTPVGMIAHGPLVWAANKDLPVNTLPELVALARSQPGRLNYGSAGVGGINHLVLESLKARTGTFITHIPYRGIAPATLDTLAGQVQLLTGTIPALAPYIRDGRLKALAVTSPERSPALPQVPGMQEAGMADFNVLNYFALVAPKGTPEAVVQQLNAALARVVEMADVKERLGKDALEPATGTPAQLAQFLQNDVEGWKRVVAHQKLKMDAF